MTPDKIEADWTSFIDELSQRLKSGCSQDELARSVCGRQIEWEGIVDNLDINDPDVPSVGIEMEEKTIEFEDGRCARMRGVDLPLEPEDVNNWRQVKIGSRVVFSAEFLSGPPFPPIRIVSVSEGRIVVILGFAHGQLVELRS